jgi:signal transduction histidine kinase
MWSNTQPINIRPESLLSEPVRLAIICAVLLAVFEVFVDWATWIQLNVSIVYGLPLVLVALARNRRLLWSLTVLLLAATFVVYAQQIPPGVFSAEEPFFLDRVLAALALVLTAALLHLWTLAVDAVEAQRQSIQVKNKDLESANRELLRYEEEISQQNEELRQRREEAEQTSKRKTQLLASVSHDIRNPVTTISLAAEAIRQAVRASDAFEGISPLADELQSSTHFLVNFVSEVLDVASFDSGTAVLHESEFCLDDVVVDSCARLRTLAASKRLFLAVNTPELPIRLRTDRVKLIRIIENLVTNAIKFTDRGGVTVTAGLVPEQSVFVRVSDTGVGIESADLQRIFNEAVQLTNPGHPQKGWGLGLAICRRLITLMGGTISVESEPGSGSSFEVRLPWSCF